MLTLADLIKVDAEGLHLPDYPQILDFLQTRIRQAVGVDLYLEADSIEGQLVAIFAEAAFDLQMALAKTYLSFSPLTAQGDALTRNVRINGIRRLIPSNGTVDVKITGTPGTTITGGQVGDAAGNKWNLPAVVTIPAPDAEIIVTATAVDEGAVRAEPGTVTKILTPTRGWISVTNESAASEGDPVESDAALRVRQAISTMIPSLSVMEGIVGAVAGLDHVTRIRGYENDTNVVQEETLIPGHTIAIVAEGGDAQEIAEAIHRKKTAGTGTYAPDADHFVADDDHPTPLPGGTTRVVADQYGVLTNINFIRPTPVRVKVKVTVTALPGYVDATGRKIQEAVSAYLNTLTIGDDVFLNRLFTPANGGNVGDGATYYVSEIKVGPSVDELEIANLTIAFNEMAVCDPADVEIVVL